MLGFWKRRKRRELRNRPFPPDWSHLLLRVPLWRTLDDADRFELEGHIQVFLAEKRFEGCNGFEVTDEVRLVVAAQACLLLLHRDTDYFPSMQTIMVYPDEFVVDVVDVQDEFVVSEYEEDRAGESWDYGPVVLSWKDVKGSLARSADGYNVVLHEFAHQLDLENGEMDGAPRLATREESARWRDVFTAAFEHHQERVSRGRRAALDPYGAEGPSEFFAVIVEAFFETPDVLSKAYPEVYEALMEYFKQDPSRRRAR